MSLKQDHLDREADQEYYLSQIRWSIVFIMTMLIIEDFSTQIDKNIFLFVIALYLW